MKVQELMSSEVESVTPRASLRHAAHKMRETGFGVLPVLDDGQLLGIITDRDISCNAIAIGRDLNSTDVQMVMTTDVATCFSDQEVSDAALQMSELHIRRLAVVDHDNCVTGILSVDDLARVSGEMAGSVLEAATLEH